jgi:hypothetical protein
MRWLQRAADAAEEAGDDRRLLVLARAATEFAQQAPKPKPPATQQAARELPRPPPAPSSVLASKPSKPPPRHQTVIGLGAPQGQSIASGVAKSEQQRTPSPPAVSRSANPPPAVSRSANPPPAAGRPPNQALAVSRTPSPPPPISRSSVPPLSRDSDPDFEQVTRVYDSGQLRAATEDTRPTQPPPRVAPSPAMLTPIPPAARTPMPDAQTPLPVGRTSLTARTPAAPAVTSRAPTPQTSSKQAGSIAPAAIKPVGAAERTQQRKPVTHRAVRVSVARQPDGSTLSVRALAEGERAPLGTREALLVPLHPDEDLF